MIQATDLTADAIVQTWIPLRTQAWTLVLGAVLFGAVIGRMVRQVLARVSNFDASGLAAVVGVIGGGAVTALFSRDSMLFGAYAVGLGIAFFLTIPGQRAAALPRTPEAPPQP